MKSIFEFVSGARDDFTSETIEITEGYEFSQYQTLRTIELYDSSRFTTGSKDSQQREKPFYNISTFRKNVATRATDLDTKDVKIEAEGAGNYAQSFLLTLFNRNWMKKSQFAQFLNKMGTTRAKYGGVMVMKTEHGGELKLHVIPWRDAITDQVDIRNNPKIIRHSYTPARLREIAEQSGWENVEDAIKAAKATQEANIAEDGKENNSLGENVEVFEVHGVLPKAYLKKAEEIETKDETTYSRQLHVLVLDESDKDNVKGVTLFSGTEKEDPTKYLPWEEVDGRGLGVGPIEATFEAQVWTNYSVKQKKDMLDLAGKILFQTTDGNIAAKNVMTDIEQGHIFKTAPNTAITQVNNMPASIPALDTVIKEWDRQAERITSTSAALTGESMPSGTPFRLAALLNQESASMFVYRRQEAGLFVQELYEDWILPFLVKKINKKDEINAELSDEEMDMLAELLADHEAETQAKDKTLDFDLSKIGTGKLFTPESKELVRSETRAQTLKGGKRRGFKLPKNFFTDDYNVDVITTGEQKNKAVVLETLYNVFSVVAKNPQVLQDPVMSRLFNQLVETAGVSPALFANSSKSQPLSTPAAVAPQVAPADAVV